jgi:putative CocE/NonD family hydrolase
MGGHAAMPAGVFERSQIDCRSDVLTYTSEPLTADLSLVGEVLVKICCQSDQDSYDLCAVLSQVYPDGSVYNVTQGYLHCQDGTNKVTKNIQLQPICIRIAKGNCLRLSLSLACYPAYAMNSGNGAVLSSTRLMNAQIITLSVSCDGSQILLPMIA